MKLTLCNLCCLQVCTHVSTHNGSITHFAEELVQHAHEVT